MAAAFISKHFPLSYPGKENQNVGFFKYSAGKRKSSADDPLIKEMP